MFVTGSHVIVLGMATVICVTYAANKAQPPCEGCRLSTLCHTLRRSARASPMSWARAMRCGQLIDLVSHSKP